MDAPKDDRFAIVDAVRSMDMPLAVGCACEDEFQEALEYLCAERGISWAEAEQVMRDRGFEMHDGILLNWNAIRIVPYPPNTEVGWYWMERTWKPEYERFRA